MIKALQHYSPQNLSSVCMKSHIASQGIMLSCTPFSRSTLSPRQSYPPPHTCVHVCSLQIYLMIHINRVPLPARECSSDYTAASPYSYLLTSYRRLAPAQGVRSGPRSVMVRQVSLVVWDRDLGTVATRPPQSSYRNSSDGEPRQDRSRVSSPPLAIASAPPVAVTCAAIVIYCQ